MTNPQHRFQFGIRHLLLTTLAAAVVIGVSAPLMRDWDADQSNRLWPIGVGLALAFIFIVPIHWCARRHVKWALGQSRWVLRQTRGWNSRFNSFFAPAALLGIVVFLIGQVVMISLDRRGMPFSYWRWFPWTMLSALPGWFGAQALLRSSVVKIGAYGIAIGVGFAPWKDVACSYEAGGKPVPLLLKLGRHVIQLHPAPSQEREIAEYLLARCLPWDGPARPSR